MNQDWCEKLGLQYPVVQAGLGGGLATAELAVAVSQAGGLGTIGLLSPERFAQELNLTMQACGTRPVAVNLLMPFLRRAHIDICLALKPAVATLFWGFNRRMVRQLHDAGIFVMHQIGSVAQAEQALADGADALIAQGAEAGGHLAGTSPLAELLPAIRKIAGTCPVLAAGGVHDASTARTAIALGSDGVVVGTRFLLTPESHAHPEYQARLLAATATLVTRLFGFGWPAPHQVVSNMATDRWCQHDPQGPRWVRVMNSLSAPSRRLIPLAQIENIAKHQRSYLPFYSPAALTRTMHPWLADVTPLYAGRCVREITMLRPAGDLVKEISSGITNNTRRRQP